MRAFQEGSKHLATSPKALSEVHRTGNSAGGVGFAQSPSVPGHADPITCLQKLGLPSTISPKHRLGGESSTLRTQGWSTSIPGLWEVSKLMGIRQ